MVEQNGFDGKYIFQLINGKKDVVKRKSLISYHLMMVLQNMVPTPIRLSLHCYSGIILRIYQPSLLTLASNHYHSASHHMTLMSEITKSGILLIQCV